MTNLVRRNAQAVMQTMDAQNGKLSELEVSLEKSNNRVTMLEQEIRTLTARFNQFFVKFQGSGATSGDLN